MVSRCLYWFLVSYFRVRDGRIRLSTCHSRDMLINVITHNQVRLVQKIDTGRVYAMKTLQKAEMLKRDQVIIIFSIPMFEFV
jgi:protein-serine/threonine kinase